MRTDSSRSLSGHVALVTGAGRGIGRAVALELASHGASVTLTDIEAPLESTQIVAGETGATTLALAMDVTNHQAVAQACDEARHALGPVSILVNNAGLQTPVAEDLHELPPDLMERMLSVHVVGASLVASALIPGMRERRYGRIVNLSSVIGLVGLQRRTPYSTAKAAISGLTRGLALENGRHGITVNAVAPGYTLTDVLKDKVSAGTLNYELFAERAAVGRWAQPWEVARVIRFLAEPDSGFITGVVWEVDGGYACNGNPGENIGPIAQFNSAM
jgi:NAD(P)-dependent dehydrogenase (short-subunit alcohol dehydrogenase family)